MKKIAILLLLITPFMVQPAFAQKKKGAKPKTTKVAISKKNQKKIAANKNPAHKIAPPPDYSKLFNKVHLIHKNQEARSTMIKNPEAIQQMEQFIHSAINQRAFPGCQVMAVKNGVIIYNKNFGAYNYDKLTPVSDTSMYDVASVSKIISTTLAVMKLVEEGKISLQGTLAGYLSWVKGTDKAALKISNLLTHQAGLKSWIPFYKATLDPETGMPRKNLYATRKDKEYATPVASNFYIKSSYEDSIWATILTSPLENKGKYVYSDLDLMFLQKVVESVTGKPLDTYVQENFYEPLGLKHTMYNPWKYGLTKQCVPTEYDNIFRLQHIQGYVHDPGAAMLGGVAGHAGVFSTAHDIAVIMQMLMNGGEYRGRKFFNKSTITQFTDYQSSISRRGYGFDKPDKKANDGGPAATACGKSTFGHQGFTGTCTWADPETGIIFVFLSNRVNPSADNTLINSLSVRTKVQEYIYKALGENR
jgi:beta-N-acetylhexosaminidase